MTEKDFWLFLSNAQSKGRVSQISGVTDACDNSQIKRAGKYIGGHSILPEGYDKIPTGKILEMGELLLYGKAAIPTKEAILILLAHHPTKEALGILKQYSILPDSELELFAQFALDECEMWNE